MDGMASLKRACPDYYQILGVERGATYREIEAAYWRLAWQRRDQLPLLNEAWEVLGDSRRRLAHNAEREASPPKPKPESQPDPRESRLGQKFRW